MITALDTNIIIDLLSPDSDRYEAIYRLYSDALRAGDLAIGEAVLSELAGQFPNGRSLDRFLYESYIRFVPSPVEALWSAGQAWRAYVSRRPDALECASCGASQQRIRCHACGRQVRSRQHIVTDFLVGAHAAYVAHRLLTRDRGYYRTYFPKLRLT